MSYILHRGAEYLASDASALALCTLATVQVFHGVSEAGGWENARKLILANPMLGGDGARVREGEGLPTFTYALGHALRMCCVAGPKVRKRMNEGREGTETE